jgi:hypothetical protein
MQDTVNHVKTDLLPEYDFDEFSKNDDYHRDDYNGNGDNTKSDSAPSQSKTPTTPPASSEVNDDDLSL